MTETHMVKSLKRLHDECERAIANERYQASASLAEQFNDLLDRFKEKNPDDEFIQEMEEAEVINIGGARGAVRNSGKALNEIESIKLDTLSLADYLEVNTDDFREITASGEMQVINVETNQNVSQSVTINNLIKEVDGMMESPENKEKLKELIREYEDELENSDPDRAKMRDLISSARDFSSQLAMKMAMAGFERGIDLLLDSN